MIIIPNSSNCFKLLLTAKTPLSHHDPASPSGGNTLTFNRQKQLLKIDNASDYSLSDEMINRFLEVNLIPDSLEELLKSLNLTEFVAASFVKSVLDIYSGGGLLDDINRYEMLENRLQVCATSAFSLKSLWNKLCKSLLLGINKGEYDEKIMQFFVFPMGFQQLVLNHLLSDYRSCVMFARIWHKTAKECSQAYVAKSGGELQNLIKISGLQYEKKKQNAFITVEVPSVSGNSLRHQVVREPAWLHLADYLKPGVLAEGAEALFVNGGNLKAGAKQPANSAVLAKSVRQTYPVLDLVGGIAGCFDLGESRLSVGGWIVCKENKPVLEKHIESDMLDVSVFDMLDEVTSTRQATESGVGQMIYNFETLCKGTQLLLNLSLHPLTPEITKSCMGAAIDFFTEHCSGIIAGQSARGFGLCDTEWVSCKPDSSVYLEYLEQNAEKLKEGLENGTFCSGTVIFT